VLFDADATGTLRCPACQAAATSRRNQRQPTAGRGYDSAHQRKRAELLGKWQAGDPCAICGQPMWTSAALDLAHNQDRAGWLGLAHAACNRATSQGKQ